MLEVVFSESAKGSMKVAKTSSLRDNYVKEFGYGTNGLETKERTESQEKGKTAGLFQDVVWIGFSMDIGDISCSIDGVGRRTALRFLWPECKAEEQDQFFEAQRRDLRKLLEAANSGTPVRIWRSSAPYSTCGFYFVCDILRQINCPLSVVTLPEQRRISENQIVSYSGWGEISPEEFHEFLLYESVVSDFEKRLYSNHWRELKIENSPLRAIVNGKLVSVPEHFYDFVIERTIPDGEFQMAMLIARLIVSQLGVSDSWYALRLQRMIEEKKLTVVKESDSHTYRKILRKADIR